MYQPQYLTAEEVERVYGEQLKALEAMHLRALIAARVQAAYGPNRWDPETGAALIEAVAQEWRALRGGDAAEE